MRRIEDRWIRRFLYAGVLFKDVLWRSGPSADCINSCSDCRPEFGRVEDVYGAGKRLKVLVWCLAKHCSESLV